MVQMGVKSLSTSWVEGLQAHAQQQQQEKKEARNKQEKAQITTYENILSHVGGVLVEARSDELLERLAKVTLEGWRRVLCVCV